MRDRCLARLLRLLLLFGLAWAGTAAAEVPLSLPLGSLVDPQAATRVGVDEQLGARIPLDLAFRDEAGGAVTLRQLVTGPTIIAPIYFACPNVCSFLQGALARALPQVRRTPGVDYQVLSVSFDATETAREAAHAKATYTQAMGRPFPPEAWHFLTGDQGAIDALTAAAGYRVVRQGQDFLHPVAIFVVSADGTITRYLYGTSILPMDLTLALLEAAEGRVSPAIRKTVQFCFSYDPQNGRYVFNIFRVSATVILLTAGALFAFLAWTGRKPQPSEPKS